MNFGFVQYSWLLLLVPAAFGLGAARARGAKRRLSLIADSSVLPGLIDDSTTVRRSGKRYTWFLTVTVLLLVLALLRPQWGFEWKESKRRGGDIVIAVDVSDSMSAADVTPSRIERARRKVSDLLDRLQGDRVALVAFAGVAFIESPLTLDYAAFRSFLGLLEPGVIPIKGSNLELALKKSLEALGVRDGSAAAPRGAAIILLTDGEELDGNLTAYGEIAKANGIRVYVLGIGTPEGAPIPSSGGYKKDRQGRVVITRLRPEVLEQVALQTGGTYVQSISGPQDIEAIYNSSLQNSLTQTDRDWANSKRWHEYYQLPLALALCLLLAGPWGRLWSLFRSTSAVAVIALCFFNLSAAKADTPEALGAEARKHFDTGNFKESEKVFQYAAEEAPEDPRMHLGIGASRYRQGDFKAAQKAFSEAAAAAGQPPQKAAALYNLGNAFVQDGSYQEAIKSYENALKLTPDDQEAKDNLAYAKKLLEEQKKQAEQDQKKDNQQKQNQQQQQEQKENQEPQQSEAGASDSSSSQSDDQSQPKKGEADSDEPSEHSESSSSQGSSSSAAHPGESSSSSSAESGQSSSSEGQSQSSSEQSRAQPKEVGTDSQEELDTVMNSVQEKQDANLRFRMNEAMKQLKAEKRSLPEKDW